MPDLNEAFEAEKKREEEKEHEQKRCLVCFNLKCTCEPRDRELIRTACL